MLVAFIVCMVASYLIGSIPFGLVLTFLSGGGDIRKIGSGNIGATNVLRTGKKGLAALTLILDGAKGWAAAYIPATLLYQTYFCPVAKTYQFISTPDGIPQCPTPAVILALIFGATAVLGHMFPVWLKFKGGKGVATFIGMMLGVLPIMGLMCIFTWLFTAVITRMSSVSALVAVGLSPYFAYLFIQTDMHHKTTAIIICALLAALVWIRHHENIARIVAGTEPKIGKKK